MLLPVDDLEAIAPGRPIKFDRPIIYLSLLFLKIYFPEVSLEPRVRKSMRALTFLYWFQPQRISIRNSFKLTQHSS